MLGFLILFYFERAGDLTPQEGEIDKAVGGGGGEPFVYIIACNA